MGRTLPLLALLLLAAPGCGNGAGDRPASGPAGKVTAVTGEVRAERGEPPASRTLALGDVVHAEDVVITAADASVRIVLDHNQATWTLEGGERRPVRESVAWTVPQQQRADPLARDDEDRTTAAGRHAEREAADTRATAADTEATDEPAAPGAELEPPPAPPPPPPRVQASREADKKSKEDGKKEITGGLSRGGSGGLGGIGTVGRGGGSGTGSGYGAGGTGPRSGPRVRLLSVDTEGELEVAIVRRVLRQYLRQLRFCYEKELQSDPTRSGQLTVAMVIAADGTVSSSSLGGGGDAMQTTGACVRRVLARVKFPPFDSGVSIVTMRLSFEPEPGEASP